MSTAIITAPQLFYEDSLFIETISDYRERFLEGY